MTAIGQEKATAAETSLPTPAAATYEDLIVTVEDHVGTIRINRPEVLNAGRIQTWAEMIAALGAFEKDDDVRVVVITGTGKAFCAGDDVKSIFAERQKIKDEMKDAKGDTEIADAAERLRTHAPISELENLMNFPKPTIAAVNGVAVGYGCDIALMCDLRVASEKARFGEAFVKRGLIPESGGLVILPMLVGWEKAHELIYTGEIIDAAEALRIGMVSRVVPHEELDAATAELAAKIAAQAPLAQRMAKRAMRVARESSMAHYFDFQRTAQELMFQTEDHREGVASFIEKRPARFKGR